MPFNSLFYFLNNVFSYFLQFDPAIFIFILSIFTVTFSTLVYKYFSDQNKIKSYKDKIKELNSKIKKESPDKALELNNEILKINFELMGLTLKPSFYTIIPMMIIFIWLSAMFSQTPIYPGNNFSVVTTFTTNALVNDSEVKTAFSSFDLIDEDVNAKVSTLVYKSPQLEGQYSYKIEGTEYPLVVSTHSTFFERSVKLKDAEMQIKTESLVVLNLFGWELGYIGAYIIYSIFVNMIVRKLFDVH